MTMFIEERINDNLIVYSTSGGPAYNTSVVQVSSGRTQRNINWAESLARFDIGERLCTIEELDEVLDFFNIAEGMAHGFRFKNWADYMVRPDQGALEQLTPTTFQLLKLYKRGPYSKTKTISKPVPNTVRVYNAGVVIPAAVVDTTTGIVTLPPGYMIAELSWSGEYDLPVNFTTNELKTRFEAMEGDQALHYLFSLPVEEIRV